MSGFAKDGPLLPDLRVDSTWRWSSLHRGGPGLAGRPHRLSASSGTALEPPQLVFMSLYGSRHVTLGRPAAELRIHKLPTQTLAASLRCAEDSLSGCTEHDNPTPTWRGGTAVQCLTSLEVKPFGTPFLGASTMYELRTSRLHPHFATVRRGQYATQRAPAHEVGRPGWQSKNAVYLVN